MFTSKQIEKYKLPSHSTSKLKSKKLCSQSSIKAFLNKRLPGKSWIGILLKDLKLLKNLFNLNHELPISCSEKSSLIITSFEFDSEFVCSSLENPNVDVPEQISVNELEDPSVILSEGKQNNCSINYSQKSAKIVQNSNSDYSSSPGLLHSITCIYYNEISALVYIITEFILMELGHIYVVSQNLI